MTASEVLLVVLIMIGLATLRFGVPLLITCVVGKCCCRFFQLET